MKTIRLVICTLSTLMCLGCRTQTQLVLCEDVTRATDMPWIASLVKTGSSSLGQKLEKIDRITYSQEGSNSTNMGFYVIYEYKCCDIPNEYIYNCDGDIISIYGGIAGCEGECRLKILTRTNIYKAFGVK